jgi:Flp pilus assembly protein protease CpaA
MDLIRILVVAVLAVIVLSLGSALFHLSRPGGDPKRLLRALTWRVGLSVALFLLLLLAWYAGLIRPHGVGG